MLRMSSARQECPASVARHAGLHARKYQTHLCAIGASLGCSISHSALLHSLWHGNWSVSGIEDKRLIVMRHVAVAAKVTDKKSDVAVRLISIAQIYVALCSVPPKRYGLQPPTCLPSTAHLQCSAYVCLFSLLAADRTTKQRPYIIF